MAMSTGTGRGWVSNSRGSPMTPASTSTLAPIRRWRERRRKVSMVVGGVGALAPLPPERSLNMGRCYTVCCKKSG